MLLAEESDSAFVRRPIVRFGFGELALFLQEMPEIVVGTEGVQISGAEMAGTQLERRILELGSVVVAPQPDIDSGETLAQARDHHGLIFELGFHRQDRRRQDRLVDELGSRIGGVDPHQLGGKARRPLLPILFRNLAPAQRECVLLPETREEPLARVGHVDLLKHAGLERGDLLDLRGSFVGETALLRLGIARLHGEVALLFGTVGLPRERDRAENEREQHAGCRPNQAPVASHEFAQPISGTRRRRHDLLTTQEPLNIQGEAAGGLVAAGAIFVDRFHHEPIEFAPQEGTQPVGLHPARGGQFDQGIFRTRNPIRGPRRLDLADQPLHFAEHGAAHRPAVERRRPGEHFVEQHSQAVDIGARVDVLRPRSLLRTHVLEGADDLLLPRDESPIRQFPGGRLGDSEVDHGGVGLTVGEAHEHVRGLEIAMDDPLAVRVLDRLTDLLKQLEAFANRELEPVAKAADRLTIHEIHHEVRTSGRGGPRVEDPSHMGMVHQRECLALLFEAGDHLLRVHPELDHLQGHRPLDRLLLLREPDGPKAPVSEFADQSVRPDHVAGGFARKVVLEVNFDFRVREIQRALDFGSKSGIRTAGFIEKLAASLGIRDRAGLLADRTGAVDTHARGCRVKKGASILGERLPPRADDTEKAYPLAHSAPRGLW